MALIDAIREQLTREERTVTYRTYECPQCDEVFESTAGPRAASCPSCGHGAVDPLIAE